MTGLLGGLVRGFGMTDAVWERHMNKWSGWSRVPTLPLIVFAIYWREALGVTFWPVLVALLVWVWVNPRAFPVPRSTDNWMSRAVMGERIWLNRKNLPVPEHYSRALPVIVAISTAGLPLIAIGIWVEQPWPMLAGLGFSLLGKFWFLDRMVWLYDDMREADPIYRSWLRRG